MEKGEEREEKVDKGFGREQKQRQKRQGSRRRRGRREKRKINRQCKTLR